MKNYVKPMVLANEELAEGVYAASGCLTMRWEAESTDASLAYWKQFRIYPTHTSSTHCSHQQTVVITFSMPVTVVDKDSSLTSVTSDGAATLTCVRDNHMNGYTDNGGSFFVKVSPTSKKNIESLTITSYSITDTGVQEPQCMIN